MDHHSLILHYKKSLWEYCSCSRLTTLGEMRRPRVPTLFPPVFVPGCPRLLPYQISGRQVGIVHPDLRLESTVNILLLLNLGKAGSFRLSNSDELYRFAGPKDTKERIRISHFHIESLHKFTAWEP